MGDLGIKLEQELQKSERNKLCKSIIEFLKTLNGRYVETWFSVKDVSLTKIAAESGIPIQHRTAVYNYLEDNNFMWRDGHASGMRWKYTKIQDPYTTGEIIYESIISPKKKPITLDSEPKTKIKSNIKSLRKTFYAVTDPVFFLANNQIKSGFVIGSRYYFISTNEDGSEGIHTMTYEHSTDKSTVLYDIAAEDQNYINIDGSSVFPSVDLLLEALKTRYNLSQKS